MSEESSTQERYAPQRLPRLFVSARQRITGCDRVH